MEFPGSSYESLLSEARKQLLKQMLTEGIAVPSYTDREMQAINIVIRRVLATMKERKAELQGLSDDLMYAGGMTEQGVLRRDTRVDEIFKELNSLDKLVDTALIESRRLAFEQIKDSFRFPGQYSS